MYIKMYVARSSFLKGTDRKEHMKQGPRFPFSTRPFRSSAIRCTAKVRAVSRIRVLNVLDMQASEGASDSSYDLVLAGRYLFIL